MEKIQCKFVERILIPSNGIGQPGRYSTIDGVTVDAKFLGTWNNSDGAFTDELDDICIRLLDAPFSTVYSLWFSRLGGAISGFWHLVKLDKV